MTAINSNRAIRGPVTAVPVVAGKGVRLTADTVNNRWVVEADETVLWEGSQAVAVGGIYNLSETSLNFERIRIEASRNAGTYTDPLVQEFVVALDSNSSNNITFMSQLYSNSNAGGSIYIDCFGAVLYRDKMTIGGFVRKELTSSGVSTSSSSPITITKIIGINRVASN